MVEFLAASLWVVLASLPFNPHPLVMALSLVASGVLLGILLNYFLAAWLMLALALVFLGGMMVIFLYFTSLISAEKLLLSRKGVAFSLLIVFIPFTSFIPTNTNRWPIPLFNFSPKLTWVNCLMISYLLLALIVAVELTYSFKGALESTD